MRSTKTLFILLLFAAFCKTEAQNYELGKVSKAELEEKAHPRDSAAVAAIVFKKARTFFTYSEKSGFTANHECQIRIKIYKKEGLNWANFEVPYYVGYEDMNDDMVKFSNGMTYNLENGNIVKTKLNGEGSFKKNVNEYWNEASITLPNVKVGSVIEFKYILKSENIVRFPVFNFQYEIPVNFSEYKTELPEYYVYKPILTGYVSVKSDVKAVNGFQNFEDKNMQSASLRYKQINAVYTAENVPALMEEDYVDNIKNYRSSIQQELERIRYPDKPEKDYSLTWEGVAKTIYEDEDFGKELGERSYLMQDIKTILKDATTKTEKLEIIFKFIQNKMNWNNDYGYYTDKGVKKAYVDQTGNVAEINFILIAMLKLAGLNANPVLTSTREHGIPVFPGRTVFNYVIAAVQIEDKQILLDATNKLTSPNILPLNVLNWTGRLIKQDGSSQEINLVPKLSSKNIGTLMATVDDFGKITGKFRIQKTDYEAFSFRDKNAKINKESYLEKMENEFNGIEISDYTVENNNTDLSKPVKEIFTFATENHCEIIADKMFINPVLFFTLDKNPFVQEKRQMPIYFGYPRQEKYVINFEIPKGFVVESIPKAITLSTPDNVALFSMNILSQGNNIQIQMNKEINMANVSADFYDILKDFYQKMIEKQNEKIVLKKV